MLFHVFALAAIGSGTAVLDDRDAAIPAATVLESVAEQVATIGLITAVPGPVAQAASPRFTYGNGARGFNYYQSRPTAAAPRPRTVGPGARNWATGNRVPLARPWMNAR